MIAAALLACAVNVAPPTMDRIIAVESGGNPLAIHVNKLAGPQPQARTVTEAVNIVRGYLARGYSVDMGRVQLNSANLQRFGYTVEDAFDDCKNIKAGGAVLSAFYTMAVQTYGEGQEALKHALSGYNTGSLQRGFENGYVGKYYINALPPPSPPRPSGDWTRAAPPPPVQVMTMVYVRPGLEIQGN